MTISRRDLFKSVGAAGVTAWLPSEPLPQARSAPDPADLIELSSRTMRVTFHRRYGCIWSIQAASGTNEVNFIGNAESVPGVNPDDSRWTGDIVTTVWDLQNPDWQTIHWAPNMPWRPSGRWRREFSGRSADTRDVSFNGRVLSVSYPRASDREGGIASYRVTMTYQLAQDGALLWDTEIENPFDHALEIGELGFPLMVNDNYSALYFDPASGVVRNDDHSKTPLIQQLIHETKVLAHHFVGGHSSYTLIQRPAGDPPFLLVHPTGDNTSFECVYRTDGTFAGLARGWTGPEILAVHSWATQNRMNWVKKPWVNGHSSLVLEPREKKTYQLRFVLVDGYAAVRDELKRSGNLGIRVLPSMVVQEDTDTYIEIASSSDLDDVERLSDGIAIRHRTRDGDKTLLTLGFKGRGQKTLRLRHGGGGARWTNLHFYCVESIEQLLKARSRFIVERQFYENPSDPYHRHHMFLPFDYRIGSTYREADEVWEVGGSDEYGFSEALFLAEKNVYHPSRDEMKTLETYVDDCLFKYIQDPQTYVVHASLYYKERYPSSPWSHWNTERAGMSYRSYNYPWPANIYHALYRVGREYGLTRRTPHEYLRISYRTCLQWFATGPWHHVGLMGGGNAVNILLDLEREAMTEEARRLRDEMRKCTDVFVQDPYPYSSELLIDQTAHEQVDAFTRYFGETAKTQKTQRVIKALRGGDQPVWFRYGNDRRRDLACWYTESLNGWALLRGFDETGDVEALIKGYAGVMSVAANMLPDGMGFGFFVSSPGVFAFDPPRTLDNGIGQYGFLKAAKAYVVRDPSFGTVGFGCRVEAGAGALRVRPNDGLRKRLRFVDQKIDIELTRGEIVTAELEAGASRLSLEMSDSSGLVTRARGVIVGMPEGSYQISTGATVRRMIVSGPIEIDAPMAGGTTIVIARIRTAEADH